jgi:DNA-binding MarR family transcriptional regulator
VERQEVAAVRRGAMRLAGRLRAERGESALEGTRLSVLGHLLRHGDLTAGDLAARNGVRPQSMTRTLADLEARGLVERARDPDDARRHVFSLTAAGLAALGDEMRPRDRWLATAMRDHLSETERRLLVLAAELLDRLADTDPAAADTDPAAADGAGRADGAERPARNVTGRR